MKDMKDELSFTQVSQLLPAYVLGLLEPQKISAIHTYLEHHRQLFKWLDEMEQNLKYNLVPMESVPPHIKSRLMALVKADLAIKMTQQSSLWLRLGSQKAWLLARALMWLVLIISSLYIGALLERFNAQSPQIQATEAQSKIIAQAERTIPLFSTDSSLIATANFYFGEQQGVLLLHGVTALSISSSQDYQLWLIPEEESPWSLGVVKLSKNLSLQTVSLPSNALEYHAVGISIEPAGGSLTPTGPVIFLGRDIDCAFSKNSINLVNHLMRQLVLEGR